MKRRIVSIVAVACALVCIALAVMLIADRHLTVHIGSRLHVSHYGGMFDCEYRSHETMTGPKEVIAYRDDEPYYVNFLEIETWRRGLPPATGTKVAGVGWATRFAERSDSGTRLAEKCYRAVLNAEYVLALVTLLGAAAVVAYMKIRRRERRLAAGLCVACGYDLRASGDRCPECGAVARNTRVPIA